MEQLLVLRNTFGDGYPSPCELYQYVYSKLVRVMFLRIIAGSVSLVLRLALLQLCIVYIKRALSLHVTYWLLAFAHSNNESGCSIQVPSKQ